MMDIDKLEAGRETDALVWLALNGKAGEMIDQGILGCRYVDGDVQPHAGYPTGHISPPYYSTDIAWAWEVLEKVASKAAGWVRLRERVCDDGTIWECDFGDYGEAARGETVSLAICRAALKTMGVGNQDNYLVVKW